MTSPEAMPFLWSYIKNVKINPKASDGQERIATDSLAEENRLSIITNSP